MLKKIIVLAAGDGKRMGTGCPKVLHPLAELPLIGHSLARAFSVTDHVACVLNPAHKEVAAFVRNHFPKVEIFFQENPQGTAHAVAQAMPFITGDASHVLVLYADSPLIKKGTLDTLYNQLHSHTMAVLGFTPDKPAAYGRLILGAQGLEKIVEAKDATKDELAVDFCNSGVMAFHSTFLETSLLAVDNKNAAKEYYITDMVALAREQNHLVGFCMGDVQEVCGINTLKELSHAEKIYQAWARQQAMEQGVLLQAPETVYFAHDTQLAPGVVVGPFVVFGAGVSVKSGAHILAFSHVSGATIAENAKIGPYARLRPGTQVGVAAKVGNFVELKNATLLEGAKVNHLSYMGDAHIGRNVNVGAGTITCNYDGMMKHATTIEDGAFIGSNTALIAPIVIGEGALVGAGSVVTESVAPDTLTLSRAPQKSFAEKGQKNRLRHVLHKA